MWDKEWVAGVPVVDILTKKYWGGRIGVFVSLSIIFAWSKDSMSGLELALKGFHTDRFRRALFPYWQCFLLVLSFGKGFSTHSARAFGAPTLAVRIYYSGINLRLPCFYTVWHIWRFAFSGNCLSSIQTQRHSTSVRPAAPSSPNVNNKLNNAKSSVRSAAEPIRVLISTIAFAMAIW